MEEENRKRAAHYVAEQLSRRRQDDQWLIRETELDPGTVRDFLRGERWPRGGTRRKIEDALDLDRGTLAMVADGWPVAQQGDPVEAAIEASPTLSRAQKLRLRAVYVEMLEDVEDLDEGFESGRLAARRRRSS